jgi:uncharacterized protein (DUF58 family)
MENASKLNVDVAGSISALCYLLKQFEVRTRRYKRFFRGKSFEFDGYRPYSSDDDVTFIDWKASRRSDNLLVKQYKEEENMKILFVVDVSENMILGSKDKLKCERAAEIVLALSYLLCTTGHKVGYVLFSDKIKQFSLPLTGLNNFYIFSDYMADAKNYGGSSKLDTAIDFVLNNFDASLSAVVLVSDFLKFNVKTKKYLELLSSRYETFAFMIRDQLDKTLPNMGGEFVLEDPNTGQQMIVEPRIARKNYERHALKQENFVIESFKEGSVDLLNLSTEDSWAPMVSNFIKGRIKGGISA